ncbi:3-(3-hydroxy-phenyl)propionate hydroxylase/6-hydroxy-3-succinoylpyridine 3-monooxygenase [Streptomyces brevispora]|uniref:3-(3-hydroxy-phenyl)propionate hydroxylase/6-hydroxy-3-succinoylpyridine 3-monooxygenase n=1 Tax=Streptomyces brevispora TaxID=887462 RepID=A0A561V469_9ACTN|nr:NAD(P)/FAD-dependent oxidoreductase [Streptomyces brevispora]TWG06414.1 3-(3-hydroxy-phenyl)propionate hydroxylase/6-hydroxy-3-succinoylpyridine 3-monooxygenase [Streptomyces brevispora]
MSEEQQVVVVGAGPTGLLTALGLAQQGGEVTVVERAPGLQDAPRAIVYHWSTLDGLDRLGLFEAARTAGFLKQDYAYRVRRTGEIVEYGLQPLAGRVKHPYNLHLGQGALARIILDEVEKFPNVRVLWGHELVGVSQDESGADLRLSSDAGETTLRAPWVVGADGARSAVRGALELGFDGMTWPERFVAANIRFPDDREGWAQSTFCVDEKYGAIIAKIDESGEHGLWRYTYMEDAALPAETVTERLPGFLAKVFGEDVAENVELDAISPYRMHQRSASTYRAGRVLLAGDAAHATNPCGGLGLTMGLFDAYALIETLGAVVVKGVDDTVLTSYADARRAAFVDKASPRATANKQLIFHSGDPAKLDQDLEVFRRMTREPELAADVMYFTKTLESPSLLAR